MIAVIFVVVAVSACEALSESNATASYNTTSDNSDYSLLATLQGKKQYQAVNIPVSWPEALVLCKQRGMDLATISSDSEYDLFKQVVKQSGIDASVSSYIYIGGAKMWNPALGWSWATDGRPLTYFPWASGEPNNSGGIENCLTALTNGAGFNDFPCDHTLFEPFVCEYFQ